MPDNTVSFLFIRNYLSFFSRGHNGQRFFFVFECLFTRVTLHFFIIEPSGRNMKETMRTLCKERIAFRTPSGVASDIVDYARRSKAAICLQTREVLGMRHVEHINPLD
jgi:hypothetical protein